MSTASGRRRRGSTSSATGEPPFEWDARNVTPATFLEAEMHWRNTLGAQHKKRSKSTGALAALKISSENARHLAAATARPDFAAAPQALSFLDMVVRELSWGGFFQKSHAQHRPSSHISNFMAVPARMERFVFFGHLVALDLFLFHITWLPLRVISSALLGAAALCRVAAPTWLWGVVVYCSSCCCCRSSAHAHGRRVCAFGHAQQFDLLKAVIIVCSTFLLGSVQPGRLCEWCARALACYGTCHTLSSLLWCNRPLHPRGSNTETLRFFQYSERDRHACVIVRAGRHRRLVEDNSRRSRRRFQCRESRRGALSGPSGAWDNQEAPTGPSSAHLLHRSRGGLRLISRGNHLRAVCVPKRSSEFAR